MVSDERTREGKPCLLLALLVSKISHELLKPATTWGGGGLTGGRLTGFTFAPPPQPQKSVDAYAYRRANFTSGCNT